MIKELVIFCIAVAFLMYGVIAALRDLTRKIIKITYEIKKSNKKEVIQNVQDISCGHSSGQDNHIVNGSGCS